MMKKNNRTTIIMSLVYVVIVVIAYGFYLRFGKGYSVFQAVQTVMLNVGNFLIVFVFGLIVIAVFLFASNKLSSKNRK